MQQTMAMAYSCNLTIQTLQNIEYTNLMKIQTKEAWLHVTLAMQKASLSIVSLNQQLIRKVPFSQI